MPDSDVYRREATLATVRAELAEDAARAVGAQLALTAGNLDDERKRVSELRAIVESQATRIAALGEELRHAVADRRQVTIEGLMSSLLAAFDGGLAGLDGRAIVAARADLRVALDVDHGVPGVGVLAPGTWPAAGLSTISVELRGLPLGPTAEEVGRAAGRVVAAVADLQLAVDRTLPAEAVPWAAVALAQVSAFLAWPGLAPGDLAARLAPTVAAMAALAGRVPALAPAVSDLTTRHRALQTGAGRDELEAVVVAVNGVTVSLSKLG